MRDEEKVRALMKSMHNPKNFEPKTIRKYGVPFGKITGSKDLSYEEKAKLLNKLIKKAEKEEKKVDKLLNLDDKMATVIDRAESNGLPIGLVGSVICTLSAYGIFYMGTYGDMDYAFAQKLGTELMGIGMVSFAGGFVVTMSSRSSIDMNCKNTVEHNSRKETLQKVKKALNTSKKKFIKKAEALKEEEIEA